MLKTKTDTKESPKKINVPVEEMMAGVPKSIAVMESHA